MPLFGHKRMSPKAEALRAHVYAFIKELTDDEARDLFDEVDGAEHSRIDVWEMLYIDGQRRYLKREGLAAVVAERRVARGELVENIEDILKNAGGRKLNS